MDLEKKINDLENNIQYKIEWLTLAIMLIFILLVWLIIFWWLTINWQVITVEQHELDNVDNWAVSYLLNIWQVLQFIPTIAMIWGWFFILSKIFWLFSKNK
jgi:hypothetical protein